MLKDIHSSSSLLSDYLKGISTGSISASSLDKMEDNLVSDLENELVLVTNQIDRVIRYLSPAENGVHSAKKISPVRNLALVNLVGRLIGHKSHLVRTQQKVILNQIKLKDIKHLTFEPFHPAASPIKDLPPQFNCSSKKVSIFYSKLFADSMDLTVNQWNAIHPLLPQKVHSAAGRPPQSTRAIINGIFWKLRTGCSWNDLPSQYPSHQTCYRYYSVWLREGVLDSAVKTLARHLSKSGYDLYTALKNKDVELFSHSGKTRICFSPSWRGTWQASTALLILQVFNNPKLKQERMVPKIDPSTSFQQ
jgi:transposase